MATAYGRRPAAAALALMLATGAASASPGSDALRRWLDAVAFGAPVSVGDTREDVAEGTVVFSQVRIGGPGSAVRLTIPTLTAIDPRTTGTGAFAAHALNADRLEAEITLDWARLFDSPPPKDADLTPLAMTVTSGPVLFERLEAPMARPDVAADADITTRWLSVVRWSQGLRADWMEASDLDFGTTMAPGARSSGHYDLLFAAGLHEGRTERFGANGFRQTDTVDGREQVTVVDTTAGVGFDGRALLEAIDPAAYAGGRGDGRWRTVIQRYRQQGMSSTIDGGTARLDALEISGLKVRQTERPLLGILQTVLKDPARVERDPTGFARDLLPSALGFWGLEKLDLEGVGLEVEGLKSFAIDGITATGMDSAGIGDLVVNGFEMSLEDGGGGSFNQMTLGDIGFGDLGVFLTLAEAGTEPPPEAVLAAALDGSPRLGFFEITSGAVQTPAGTVSVDTFAVTASRFLKSLPRRSDLTFTNLALPRAVFGDPATVEALGAMGYDTVTLSAGATVDWDTDAGRVSLEDLTVRAGDMGVVSADAVVTGVPLSALAAASGADGRPFPDAALASATVRYGNLSLVEKIFEWKAAEMKQEPDAFRRNVAGALPLMLGFVGDKALQERITAPLKAFFEMPQSLTLTLRPAAPLPFAAMETIAADGFGPLAAALGFRLTSP